MITSLINHLLLEHQEVTFKAENNLDFLEDTVRIEALEDVADLEKTYLLLELIDYWI